MGGKSSSSSASNTTQTTTSNIGDTKSINIEFGSSTFNTGHLETSRISNVSPTNNQTPTLNSTTTQRNDSSATGATIPVTTIPGLSGGDSSGVGSALGDIAGLASAGLGAYGAYKSSQGSSYYDSSSGSGYDTSSYNFTSSTGLSPLLLLGAAGVAVIYFLT